jgi:hypothetical protein
MFRSEGMCSNLSFKYYFLYFRKLLSIVVSGVPAIILHNFTVPSAKKKRFRTANLSRQQNISTSINNHCERVFILYNCSVTAKQSSSATRHDSAWRERKYSSYSFLTSALDGGEWSASRPGRVLPWGKELRYPLYRRLGGPQSWSRLRG